MARARKDTAMNKGGPTRVYLSGGKTPLVGQMKDEGRGKRRRGERGDEGDGGQGARRDEMTEMMRDERGQADGLGDTD